jgi:hypothetical protein
MLEFFVFTASSISSESYPVSVVFYDNIISKTQSSSINSNPTTTTEDTISNSAATPKMRITALFPMACAIVAFVLSMLCIFAGHKKGFMEDYSILTVCASPLPSVPNNS